MTIFFLLFPNFVKSYSELRADSLARILHLGDVQANGVIGVMETCSGLVSGSVLNRIGSKKESFLKKKYMSKH